MTAEQPRAFARPGSRVVAYLVDLFLVAAVAAVTYWLLESWVIAAILVIEIGLVFTIARAARGWTLGGWLTKTVARSAQEDRPPGIAAQGLRSLIMGVLHFTVIGPLVTIMLTKDGQDWVDRVTKMENRSLRPAPAPGVAEPSAPKGAEPRGSSPPAAPSFPPAAGPPIQAPAPVTQPSAPARSWPQPPVPAEQPEFGLNRSPAASAPLSAQAAGYLTPPQASPHPVSQQPAPGPTPPVAPQPPQAPPPSRAFTPADTPQHGPPPTRFPWPPPAMPSSSEPGPVPGPPEVPVPRPLPGDEPFTPTIQGGPSVARRAMLSESTVPSRSPVWLMLDTGTRVEIKDVLILGRDPRPTGEEGQTVVPVPDPRRLLSRSHARIGVDGGGVWVEDCYSTNGTFCRLPNGRVLDLLRGHRYHIPVGTVVLLGDRSGTITQG